MRLLPLLLLLPCAACRASEAAPAARSARADACGRADQAALCGQPRGRLLPVHQLAMVYAGTAGQLV